MILVLGSGFQHDPIMDTAGAPLALVRILPARQRLWEDPGSQKLLHVPLGSALGYPGPEDPAGMLLIRIELSINERSEIVLVSIAQRRDGTGILPIT